MASGQHPHRSDGNGGIGRAGGLTQPLLIAEVESGIGSEQADHEERLHTAPLSPMHSLGKFHFPAPVHMERVMTVDALDSLSALVRPSVASGKFRFSWRKLWAFTGPGVIMSIAFFDPGNLESDLQNGAETGYRLLWVMGWSTVVGLLFQLLAARIGVVTGKDLAEVLAGSLPDRARVTVWFLVELAIVGSDIQEVMGCAIGIAVLSNGRIPLWLGTMLTALDSFVFLLLEGTGIRWLEGFFTLLVAIMAVSFGLMFAQAAPSAGEILHGLVVPELGPSTIKLAAAMLGAVIMPHNLFLHSALVKTRDIERSHVASVREANCYFALESAFSLLMGFFINLFVMAVAAEGCKGMVCTNLGLASAGDFLEKSESFGELHRYIWGVGLIAAGQSSTMTGTYAGQFVMQGFLQMQLTPWQRVVVTRTLALGPALVVALATSGAGTLDETSDWLNVLQSVQLPFAIVPVTILSGSRKVMGVHANSLRTDVLCALLILIVLAVNAFLFVDFVQGAAKGSRPLQVVAGVLAGLYLALLAHITWLVWVGHRERSYSAVVSSSADDGPADAEAIYLNGSDRPRHTRVASISEHTEQGGDEDTDALLQVE